MCLFEVCGKWFKQTRVCNAVPLVWGLSGLPQLQCCCDFSQSVTYKPLHRQKRQLSVMCLASDSSSGHRKRKQPSNLHKFWAVYFWCPKVDIVYTRANMNAQESLVRSKVLRYFAHVTVACVTLHTSAFCRCYLQESSSAQRSCCTRRYKCSDTVGGSNDERLTDVGMTEVVPMLVSHLSLLPPGIILCLTVSVHLYPPSLRI